ncbi:hypothetical protein L0128_04855 [candidate division KSB1 bacterium]|nr:hypothetical protein [candidate division KSB1 bacterium]
MWMYWIYNLILLGLFPGILVYFLFFSARSNIRGTLAERLGQVDFSLISRERPRVWLHAASAGEAQLAVELGRAVRNRFESKVVLVLTVLTKSGYTVATQTSLFNKVIYLPFDLPWIVKRVVRRIAPVLLILIETELWPNLLKYTRRSGAKIMIANGRISEKSFPTYQRWRCFFRRVLAHVDQICVQNEAYQQRYLAIGARPERLITVGNIKDEQALNLRAKFMESEVIQHLHLPEHIILAAVSTHSGEDELLCRLYQELRFHSRLPRLKLILAPRHLHRVDEIIKILKTLKLTFIRRSEHPKIFKLPEHVILWDSFGELGLVYASSAVTLVGGSWTPVGGHSLMEPAAFKTPVIWGPHAFNFRETAEKLLAAGGGYCVSTLPELVATCKPLLRSVRARQKVGQAALACVNQSKGAVQKHLTVIENLLIQIRSVRL